MRPASEPHLALLRAAQQLRLERAATGQGATLLEMVQRSQVGYQVAKALVPKLKKLGHLQITGERPVDYRNRPVKEYAPRVLSTEDVQDVGVMDLGRAMRGWHS